MPRGRKSKLPHLNKQNKIIATRLMELSLKVDDYVYNHKPICESKAEMYINEISSYKEMCFEDDRSLQVIEKLTRCMKGIISEQKELKAKVCDIENFNTESAIKRIDSVSPVYSLTDEDRSQLSQEFGNIETIIDLTDEKVNQIELDEKVNSKTKEITGNENFINTFIDTGVTMHKAISNLSLKDIQDPSLVSPDIVDPECSQSLIQNNAIPIPLSNINLHQDMNIASQSGTETMKFDAKEVRMNDVTKIDLKNKHNVMKTSRDKKAQSQNNNIAKDTKVKTKEKDCTTCASGDIKSKKRNKKPQTKKPPSKLKENEQSKKKTTKNKNITKAKDITGPTDLNNEFNKYINSNINPDNASNVQIVNNEQISTIYNSVVENDLSWIENIRYVREVAANEYIPELMNLTDGFWDNCSLPGHWDDQEFVYD